MEENLSVRDCEARLSRAIVTARYCRRFDTEICCVALEDRGGVHRQKTGTLQEAVDTRRQGGKPT